MPHFIEALKERFYVEAKPWVDWYLQTHIQQDKDGNVTLDQMRYSKEMVARFYISTDDYRPKRGDVES